MIRKKELLNIWINDNNNSCFKIFIKLSRFINLIEENLFKKNFTHQNILVKYFEKNNNLFIKKYNLLLDYKKTLNKSVWIKLLEKILNHLKKLSKNICDLSFKKCLLINDKIIKDLIILYNVSI